MSAPLDPRAQFYKDLARNEVRKSRQLTQLVNETNKALAWAIETLTITTKTLTEMHDINKENGK